MNHLNFDRSQIQGWGVDLDEKDRPAVPKEKFPPNGTGAHWSEPDQQISDVKILCSIERPRISPVFGTTVPPKGLSGMIRSLAFRYSENQMRHWMLLLFADRVNMVEGLVDDLSHGTIPNPIKETGFMGEFKYNRKGAMTKVAVAATILISIGLIVATERRKKLLN